MVGGTMRSRTASNVATNSSAPAAPSAWPTMDLVDEIASLPACGPNASCSALVSVSSLAAVPVPWALTY